MNRKNTPQMRLGLIRSLHPERPGEEPLDCQTAGDNCEQERDQDQEEMALL